jgi:GNAT superfamily N-acetyltransferase
MKSLRKELLNQADEIYRLILTMLKKLKLSKKEDRLVIAEATSDITWLARIMPFLPWKYSMMLQDEEAAKLIFYRSEGRLHLHDLYVNPKYRKQGIAKMLTVEVLSDNRDLTTVSFHTRESNKPIHNLATFFIRQFKIALDQVSIETTSEFYVDGGKAVLYTMPNPAFELAKTQEEEPNASETVEPIHGLPEDDRPSGGRPEIPVEVGEHETGGTAELGEVGQVLRADG